MIFLAQDIPEGGIPYWLGAVIATALVSAIISLFTLNRSKDATAQARMDNRLKELKDSQDKHDKLQEKFTSKVESLKTEAAIEIKELNKEAIDTIREFTEMIRKNDE